jgi:replicative DNA helicase
MDDEQMEQLYTNGLQPLTSAQIFIDDTPALNITQLRSKARRLKSKHGIRLIVIDYLQLMSGTTKDSNREQEISNISRSLKTLAKELDLPIIALSQLNREVEKRKGEPQLSDLRESGAIEQDADLVTFLYKHPENKNVLFKITKHRNGSLVTLEYEFLRDIQKLREVGIYNPSFKINTDGFPDGN